MQIRAKEDATEWQTGERKKKKKKKKQQSIKPSPRLYAFAGPSLAPIPSAQTVAQLPTPRSASWRAELQRARASRERRERAESMLFGKKREHT